MNTDGTLKSGETPTEMLKTRLSPIPPQAGARHGDGHREQLLEQGVTTTAKPPTETLHAR